MADNKAKIKIDIEGQAEAERKLKKIRDGFKDWGREIGGIVSGMVRDFASTSASLARVDPGNAAQKFRDYRRTVTEASVASQRSIGDLKASFAGLSDRTLLPDEQVADFSQSLAKATYDFGDSSKALEALRGTGVMTGRSLDEMGGIAETLHNTMGTSLNDIPQMLGHIEGAANALGTVGGPAALMDDITALGGVLSQVSIRGKHDAEDLIATMAAIGKGLRPEQQRNVQAGLIGRFTSGGEQMRRNLGIKREDFYDEKGGVRVTPQNVQKLRDFYLNKTGGNVQKAQDLAAFNNNLGPQLAAALFRPGLMQDVKKAATAPEGTGGQKALDALAASDHGKETKAQIDRDRNTREGMGATMNNAQQKTAAAMPDNAWARAALMGVGGGIAGKAFDAALGALGKSAGYSASKLFAVGESGGKATLGLSSFGGKLAGFVGKGAGVAAVGLAGYELGTWADKKLGISTAIANALDRKSAAKEEKGVDANKKQLAALAGNKASAVAAYESRGMSHGQAVYYAEHPKEAPPPQKTQPVDVHLTITDASSHPNQVVQVAKGQAGRQ